MRIMAIVGMLLLASVARATEIVSGPMIGHVTDSSARIWFQTNTTERVQLRVFDVDARREVSGVTIDVEGPAPFVCDAPVSNLEANRNYRIEIEFDGKPVRFAEPLLLRSAPPPGEPASFAVVFGAGIDLGPQAGQRVPVAAALKDAKPRAMVFLGSSGYLPEKDEDFPATRREAYRFLWKANQAVRRHQELAPLFRTIPCYGTWGTRDYGPPNADQGFVYAQEALIGFQKFWPNPNYGTPQAPGAYTSFSLGDVDFFLLDTRRYRDQAKGTMLGEVQLAWLKKQLLSSAATFKVIAAGAELFGNDPKADTWSACQREREAIVDLVMNKQIRGVLLVSGGGRYGELLRRKPVGATQYPIYEMAAGPLRAAAADSAPENPQRLGEPLLGNNFGVLEFGGGSKAKRFVTMQLRDEQGKVRLEQTIFAGNLQAE